MTHASRPERAIGRTPTVPEGQKAQRLRVRAPRLAKGRARRSERGRAGGNGIPAAMSGSLAHCIGCILPVRGLEHPHAAAAPCTPVWGLTLPWTRGHPGVRVAHCDRGRGLDAPCERGAVPAAVKLFCSCEVHAAAAPTYSPRAKLLYDTVP